MVPVERDVCLENGRTLHVVDEGDPRGRPVFFLHGTPSSRLLYSGQAEDARRRGIRLIGYDRPGYGGSTPNPGRSVADGARDVASIADDLGLDRFAVYGLSGGGPHTLACGTLPGQRIVAIASLASPAPYPAERLDWFRGQGEGNIAEFSAALEGRLPLERFLEPQRETLLTASAEAMVAAFGSLLSPVDVEAFAGELGSYFVSNMREALRPGIQGWRDDDLAFVRPWGFELSQIGSPVQIWQGAQDRMVPFAHGEWLSAHVPRADIHLEPRVGHITLFDKYPVVHQWLASHF
jgi:pimeloyl-ACP methyl ester carboxylesterase